MLDWIVVEEDYEDVNIYYKAIYVWVTVASVTVDGTVVVGKVVLKGVMVVVTSSINTIDVSVIIEFTWQSRYICI